MGEQSEIYLEAAVDRFFKFYWKRFIYIIFIINKLSVILPEIKAIYVFLNVYTNYNNNNNKKVSYLKIFIHNKNIIKYAYKCKTKIKYF